MTDIKGIVVPIVTPMNEDESLNLKQLDAQIDRMINEGIDGIFVFGTNGEGFILNGEEKKAVLEEAIKYVAGRVPVYAGTGCISTKETIEQSKMAQDLGADVLSIITPSFAKASQEELYRHYKAVAEAVPNMPILLYNIPARTGNALEPATVERLAAIDNIVGAKDSSGNWDNLKAYIAVSKKYPDFAVLSGSDGLILKALKEGAKGAIAGCANVYPHTLASIYDNFVAGDMDAAQKAQDSIASFRATFKYGNNNTIVKIAVNELGIPVGSCKAPFNWLSDEGMAALRRVLIENKQKGMH